MHLVALPTLKWAGLVTYARFEVHSCYSFRDISIQEMCKVVPFLIISYHILSLNIMHACMYICTMIPHPYVCMFNVFKCIAS